MFQGSSTVTCDLQAMQFQSSSNSITQGDFEEDFGDSKVYLHQNVPETLQSWIQYALIFCSKSTVTVSNPTGDRCCQNLAATNERCFSAVDDAQTCLLQHQWKI